MRILAVGAHPDDIEILCAGTLLRYADEGHEIIMAVATNGEQGHIEIMPAELAEIRRKEAEASAAIAGARLIWMGYRDQFLFHSEDTRRHFIEMIRQADPDIIITHNPDDYSQDHKVVSELVFTASFQAGVPHIFTDTPAIQKLPALYYMDNVTGTDFLPTELVDISSVIDRKAAMLECHQSQLVWLKEHDDLDVVDMMKTVAKFRALSCQGRVAFAEGFKRLDAWGRNPVKRLLP
jgi:LmbE family N-acetylglucosaminyl deacetylase